MPDAWDFRKNPEKDRKHMPGRIHLNTMFLRVEGSYCPMCGNGVVPGVILCNDPRCDNKFRQLSSSDRIRVINRANGII